MERIHASRIAQAKWRGRFTKGASWFELMVVLTAACIIGFFFLDRVLLYQEMAEKTAVETSILTIRTSLRYRLAHLLIHHQESDIGELIGVNPILLLDKPPPGYIGEIGQVRWDRIPPGSWYFDVGKKELVYRVKNTKHFLSGSGEQQKIRLCVTTLSKQPVKDTKFNNRPIITEGISLILIERYVWF